MLSLLWGENRVEAEKAVKGLLGVDYEVFEGESLTPADLPSIFQGTSLFGTERRQILLKDLGENAAVWEKIPDYAETSHDVVIWELKVDKRSSAYKKLKAAGIEMKEFLPGKNPDMKLVFGIFDLALRNGPQAVKMLKKIELEQDPYLFFGLLASQAIKRFDQRPGRKEKVILKELSRIDMQMKTTSVEPWLLLKSFLLRLSQI